MGINRHKLYYYSKGEFRPTKSRKKLIKDFFDLEVEKGTPEDYVSSLDLWLRFSRFMDDCFEDSKNFYLYKSFRKKDFFKVLSMINNFRRKKQTRGEGKGRWIVTGIKFLRREQV